MAYESAGDGALDYFPCRYGGARVLFRGPARDLRQPYLAALGGTETYGKFVARPWPARAEAALGLPVVNLGCPNAGPDVLLAEPEVTAIARGARLSIVQVVGAANLSNRYYTVHPRRNDRFLQATPALQALVPGMDFTEVAFTRHLLLALAAAPDALARVAEELQRIWICRMTELLQRIEGRALLLWLADRPPPPPGPVDLTADPLLVDTAMLAALRPHCRGLVSAVYPAAARGGAGMVCTPIEAPAAAELPGPAAHALAAEALLPALGRAVPV